MLDEQAPGGMYLDHLQRHLTVCSRAELPTILNRDPRFWHVVSIREPAARKVDGRYALSVHHVAFEDREQLDKDGRGMMAAAADIASIFAFVDSRPGAPVLVHCAMGQSRSPAVALALIVRGLRLSLHLHPPETLV